MKKLSTLRQQIDSIDQKLVELLNKRTEITSSIGKVKVKNGLSIFASEREVEVYKKIHGLNDGPLKNESLTAIYREIMSASLLLEKPLKIAFLGPPASFTNLAAKKKFGSSLDYKACDSIAEVFLDVEKGRADYGVVPIENSIEGAVTHTMDMLVDSSLTICSELYLKISHNLLSNCTNKKHIKNIYTINQVFGQCRAWIERNYPHVGLVEVSSTTRAAELVKNKKTAACIASLLAAKQYKLKVIERSIEDSPDNVTRFLVVGKFIPKKTGSDKTSIVFSVKDKVGILHDMLEDFKSQKINLTKIESRPNKKKPWEYYFYVDLLGHYQDVKVKKSLEKIDKHSKFLKILGSYPNMKEISV